MGDFCKRCGSLLIWDISSGGKKKICPRCGELEGTTSKPEIPVTEKANGVPEGKEGRGKRRFSVRKGVSPRTSRYASDSIYRKVEREMPFGRHEEEIPGDDGEIGGIPAPRKFPFDTVRKGQKEFMDDVDEVVREGGFLLANVPTGIGKTAAALTPALEYGKKNGKMVLFMTSKQSQHRIVIDTLRRAVRRSGSRVKVVDITSKQSMCPRELSRLPHSAFSFMCREQSRDGTCPFFKPPPPPLIRSILEDIHDVSDIGEISMQWRICPHRAALEAARGADVLVCDFNYLFSDLSDAVLSGLGKKLEDLILIIDEAHNLPDRIRSNQSEEMSLRILEEALERIPRKRRIRTYLSEMRDFILKDAKKRLGDEREVLLGKREFISGLRGIFVGSIDGSMDLEMFVEMLEGLARKEKSPEENDPIASVAGFLERMLSLKESHILYFTVPREGTLESLKLAFKNLDPGEISGPVFKGCHSAVLMSGTLSPPSMFGDILGMRKIRRTEREYPSPFPEKNKMVLLDDGITTAYRKRNGAMYRKIGERIISLAGSVPGNAAVFFPSYSILLDVKEYLWGCPKRIVVEERSMSRSDKERLVNELRAFRSTTGALLMGVLGGSLSEGVDYRDNLLSAVLVVGIPLAPPSLEVTSLREYFRGKFGYILGEEYSYIYPAMNRILQAAGRCIRSGSDRAVIVLMEERLKQPRYLKFLPGDLRPMRLDGMSMETAVERFFSGRGSS